MRPPVTAPQRAGPCARIYGAGRSDAIARRASAATMAPQSARSSVAPRPARRAEYRRYSFVPPAGPVEHRRAPAKYQPASTRSHSAQPADESGKWHDRGAVQVVHHVWRMSNRGALAEQSLSGGTRWSAKPWVMSSGGTRPPRRAGGSGWASRRSPGRRCASTAGIAPGGRAVGPGHNCR
jgi:hypothetical protein